MTSHGENFVSSKQLRHGGEIRAGLVGTIARNIHTHCVQSYIQSSSDVEKGGLVLYGLRGGMDSWRGLR